tara:strand:- start:249 stop:1004 length:756 start_codon:yes stop_codon:yes gene_type:complete
MSLKSLIQVIITLIIIIILGGVYFNYFSNNNKIILEDNEQKEIGTKQLEKKEIGTKQLEKKEIEKAPEESVVTSEKEKKEQIEKTSEEIVINEEKTIEKVKLKKKPEIDNLVKDIEYLTTDKKGNNYRILATSGRTNTTDKNILDLDNVRGIITSKDRSTIYIVSDFAEYNSSNLKSNFYQNVVINYEDKEITCDYFDIDMKTNIAIAYNNVVVTDPESIMKAGKIILNIETKIIDINPDNNKNKVKITIN